MLGPPKARNLDRPVLLSLESAVPQDHFYRHLERTLDLSFVRDLVADRYAVAECEGVGTAALAGWRGRMHQFGAAHALHTVVKDERRIAFRSISGNRR